MRTNFISRLVELAEKDERIVLLCGDLGYSVLEKFAQKFPERFYNVGIAEQNMIQLASGLALEGFQVYVYSIGNFPTLRCMEQIRYDVCYHNLNVKIISVGAGYAYGPLGVSHHTTEDLAMLRSIPNMTVLAPGDVVEAKACTEFLHSQNGPGYMRINKAGDLRVHESDVVQIQDGHGLQLRSGQGTGVLCSGAVLGSIARQLENHGENWSLYSCPLVSHLNRSFLKEIANKYEHLVTVEEHQLNGGFGSAVIEALSDLYNDGAIKKFPKVRRIGIPGVFQSLAGTQDFLRQKSGLVL